MPINNTQQFQLVKISTANYLMLCEVEVYAGIVSMWLVSYIHVRGLYDQFHGLLLLCCYLLTAFYEFYRKYD